MVRCWGQVYPLTFEMTRLDFAEVSAAVTRLLVSFKIGALTFFTMNDGTRFLTERNFGAFLATAVRAHTGQPTIRLDVQVLEEIVTHEVSSTSDARGSGYAAGSAAGSSGSFCEQGEQGQEGEHGEKGAGRGGHKKRSGCLRRVLKKQSLAAAAAAEAAASATAAAAAAAASPPGASEAASSSADAVVQEAFRLADDQPMHKMVSDGTMALVSDGTMSSMFEEEEWEEDPTRFHNGGHGWQDDEDEAEAKPKPLRMPSRPAIPECRFSQLSQGITAVALD